MRDTRTEHDQRQWHFEAEAAAFEANRATRETRRREERGALEHLVLEGMQASRAAAIASEKDEGYRRRLADDRGGEGPIQNLNDLPDEQ